jgi:anti-sigma factor RsiW
VRCSSCEPLLDRYVEGTLPPRTMASVGAHLRLCPHCAELLTELRVVDALLATTKPLEIAPNFTFAVMAEARSMPIAPGRTPAAWALLAFYLVAAWLGGSGAYAFFGNRLPSLAGVVAWAGSGFSQFAAATGGVSHAIAPATPFVATFVIGALLVDALLVAAIFLFHRTVRPHLAARLARSEPSS